MNAELLEALMPLARGRVRCAWASGAKPGEPFTSAEPIQSARYDRTGTSLWTSDASGRWSQWELPTGRRLRVTSEPDIEGGALRSRSFAHLVVRDRAGHQKTFVRALSPDGRRAVVERNGHELCDATDGRTLTKLSGVAEPFAFSTDGAWLYARTNGALTLTRMNASDGGDPSVVSPPIGGLMTLPTLTAVAPGILVLTSGARAEASLTCIHLDAPEKTWHAKGWFRATQLSADGRALSASTLDFDVWVWDVDTGEVRLVVEGKQRPRGPLVAGEPDTIDMVRRLRESPIELHTMQAVRSVRSLSSGARVWVDGFLEKKMFDSSSGDERPGERASEAEATPAQIARATLRASGDASLNLRASSRDGRRLVFLVQRNCYSVPDPDAGTVYYSDASLGLWDDEADRWLWETTEVPGGYGGSYLAEQCGFAFTSDERGVSVRAGGSDADRVIDVESGAIRAFRDSDRLPSIASFAGAAGASVLAASDDRERVLSANGSSVEIWDVSRGERLGAIDLGPLDDRPTAAASVSADGAFVVGTAWGRLLRVELVPSAEG